MKRKKEYLVSSVLFMIGTGIWIINLVTNYQARGIIDISFLLQICCAFSFGMASVVNFIRYRQSNRDQDD